MWLMYLEAGVALGLALFIVWFTWPKKRPEEKREKQPQDDKSVKHPRD
jgi:hypothetical protein